MNHHVYRAYDSAGSLLYVGITDDLEQRLSNHRTSSGWWMFKERVESEPFSTRALAEDEERNLIQTLHPRWNRRDRVAGGPKGERKRYLMEKRIAQQMGELQRERSKVATDLEDIETSIAILTFAIDGMNAAGLPSLRVVSKGGAS